DSHATNLVSGDTNGQFDVFVHDSRADATTRVSVASGGSQGNYYSHAGGISADGRFVAFTSAANNLVAGDTNDRIDVFVRDRKTGRTTRVSLDSHGKQGGRDRSLTGSSSALISADGRYVGFLSSDTNLVRGDTNRWPDVFVRDRRTRHTIRVDVSSDG